jgi:hypothetical protein
MSLELLLQREADARAVLRLLERGLPMGSQVMQYVALFRPAQRRLGLARMASLVDELLVDIERQAVTRKGRDWVAAQPVWAAALQTVLGMRDAGKLRLPLTSHGLLHEVICGLSGQDEARAERERETDRRARRGTGGRTAGPVDMAQALAGAADAAAGASAAEEADEAQAAEAHRKVAEALAAARSKLKQAARRFTGEHPLPPAGRQDAEPDA